MYLPPSDTPGVVAGHGLDDAMRPWDGEPTPPTPRSVLNHHALDYSYDNEPTTTPENVALTIGAPPISASIGRAGEVDIFTFEVSAAGNHVIETQGTTDVVIGLGDGLYDSEVFITEDDDSEAGQNLANCKEICRQAPIMCACGTTAVRPLEITVFPSAPRQGSLLSPLSR